MSAAHWPGEMAVRSNTQSLLSRTTDSLARPASSIDDNFFTEFEDDESDVEQGSLRSSNESIDDRRRSDTTISSYEVATPQTENEHFQVLIKPVEGPQGPHLFRASTSSAEFTFDYAMQMSPIDLKVAPPTRPETAKGHRPASRMTRRSLPPVPANIPGLPANLRDWSPDDVVDWMYSIQIDNVLVERFQENDISGSVLVDMNFEDLKDLGIQSFGKRHELWQCISALKGGEAGPSPVPTPFQDLLPHSPVTEITMGIQSPASPSSACSATTMEDLTPVKEVPPRRRRGRKHKTREEIDLAAMSFIAIEEYLPKEHKCSKGKDCEHWQKWSRRVQRSKKFNEELNNGKFPIKHGQDGTTLISGDPANAATAPHLAQKVKNPTEHPRPISECIPSIVASSDVLGPDQLPDIALHEEILSQLERRDPLENVKHFLDLQHVSSPMERPEDQDYETFDEPQFEMFPSTYHQPAYGPRHSSTVPLQPLQHTPAPLEHLKQLPKLTIPRAATASPAHLGRASSTRSDVSALSPNRSTATAFAHLRASTPASEMDVPVTVTRPAPVPRDTSQSVPPNMQFRDQIISPASAISRSNSRVAVGRPSFAMPSLHEDEVFSPFNPVSPTPLARSGTVRRGSDESSSATEHEKLKQAYGDECTYAGFMKKRRTRLLRHDWQESHFRLAGTSLSMHANEQQKAKAKDTINVDEYTVNCSSTASNSKVSAALKKMKILEEKKDKQDVTSFAFQLVPEWSPEKKKEGKTHHFAVGGREERIDWMRELMLAKAKGKRDAGYNVQINGV